MKVRWYFLIFIILFSCRSEPSEVKSSIEQVSTDPILIGMEQALEKNPNDISILLEKAAYLYKNSQYDLALQDINKAIQIDPKNWDLYHIKADILLDSNKPKEAINTLQYVTEKEPSRIPSFLKLAEFQHIAQDYNSSISTVHEVIRLQSYNAEAYFMLGMNYRAMENLADAKTNFLQAVYLDAGLTDAWILLGSIAETERDVTVEDYYQNAILSNPNSIEAIHALAYDTKQKL